MIKVKTKDDKYIGLIEVPKLAFYFDWRNNPSDDSDEILIYYETEDNRRCDIRTEFTSPNQFEILNKLSQLDKELEEFVDFKKVKGQYEYCYYFKDYPTNTFTYGTIRNSFISLIKSQHPEFDKDKEYLLIKLL